ncbi:uncharacterized protein EI90DRAFT_3037633 [Cantharellus anzutake]|uniref:uncharacterized protein n=1 Tax=Cantharellus anzutake TaxID=1750568 RepID=UPI00190390A4|nr:uncharacterized protein EI90DRAFT_3037633 [Cantharellus anzutake]KAF8339740.1 hypothetical protein EI90DRAFT_3037633 [Cantharellus anzutake]
MLTTLGSGPRHLSDLAESGSTFFPRFFLSQSTGIEPSGARARTLSHPLGALIARNLWVLCMACQQRSHQLSTCRYG